MRRLILIFLLTIQGYALAQDSLIVQAGVAYNHSLTSYYKPGTRSFDAERPDNLSQAEIMLGIGALAAINPNWRIGVGGRINSHTFDLTESMAVVSLDLLKLEYQFKPGLAVRFNFGVSKQYQTNPAYGKQGSLVLLKRLTPSLNAGLLWQEGEADQEQGLGTDKIGGQITVIAGFIEKRF